MSIPPTSRFQLLGIDYSRKNDHPGTSKAPSCPVVHRSPTSYDYTSESGEKEKKTSVVKGRVLSDN